MEPMHSYSYVMHVYFRSTIVGRPTFMYTVLRIAEVKDVVHAVLYLLSDKSDMINGVTLMVDGGLNST